MAEISAQEALKRYYIMVFDRNGVWDSFPATWLFRLFRPPKQEIWVEVRREKVSGSVGNVEGPFERILYECVGSSSPTGNDCRKMEILTKSRAEEVWIEVERTTEEVTIEDPESNAELKYKRIEKITYELEGSGDGNGNNRVSMTLKQNPPE